MTSHDNKMTLNLNELKRLAEEATPGPWMRLFGERTVYDRMEDGCRGNAIVRADVGWSSQDYCNLDYIAAANPATILALIERIEEAETRNALQQRALDAKQAEIDRLMLEYCPNEMTPEQLAEWEKHQRPAANGGDL